MQYGCALHSFIPMEVFCICRQFGRTYVIYLHPSTIFTYIHAVGFYAFFPFIPMKILHLIYACGMVVHMPFIYIHEKCSRMIYMQYCCTNVIHLYPWKIPTYIYMQCGCTHVTDGICFGFFFRTGGVGQMEWALPETGYVWQQRGHLCVDQARRPLVHWADQWPKQPGRADWSLSKELPLCFTWSNIYVFMQGWIQIPVFLCMCVHVPNMKIHIHSCSHHLTHTHTHTYANTCSIQWHACLHVDMLPD